MWPYHNLDLVLGTTIYLSAKLFVTLLILSFPWTVHGKEDHKHLHPVQWMEKLMLTRPEIRFLHRNITDSSNLQVLPSATGKVVVVVFCILVMPQ